MADERRQEQRRQARLADERRQEQRRQARIADERRQEQRRQDRIKEDRQRDDQRRDRIAAENRRQDREYEKKDQEQRNDLAKSLLRSGNAAAAALVWNLDIGSSDIPSVPAPQRIAPTPWVSSRDWSAVFKALSPQADALPAPDLEMTSDVLQGTSTWTWTAVAGATGYVLEQARDAGFADPVEIYRGTNTEYTATTRMDFTSFDLLRRYRAVAPNVGHSRLGATRFYRVKATGDFSASDSPWSNVV
jgi:hypothetical protein